MYTKNHMKTKYLILCIEDEADVLEAVLRDLKSLESNFLIEGFSSAEYARKYLQKLSDDFQPALFICDHIMPGTTGVEFIVELEKNGLTQKAKKMLLTGQAGLQDTIMAINLGKLDFYLAKPWDKKSLLAAVINLLTKFIIENKINPLTFMEVLDPTILAESMRSGKYVTDR